MRFFWRKKFVSSIWFLVLGGFFVYLWDSSRYEGGNVYGNFVDLILLFLDFLYDRINCLVIFIEFSKLKKIFKVINLIVFFSNFFK